MRTPNLSYRKLVLVCTNERNNGRECCKDRGGANLFVKLKAECAQRDPSVRVSRASCLGNCLSGAIVVIMPDNIWLGEVKPSDVPEILEKIFGNEKINDDFPLMGDEDFLGI